MDIKVITRHSPSNYGSVLQALATTKIIEKLGHKCTIIDYVREDEKGIKSVLTALKSKKEWGNSLIKRILYIILRYPEELIAQIRFNKIRNKYLHLTRRYKTSKDLSTLQADIFMTGSDQVWGPTINGKYDENYFLSFVVNKPKIAYAASFGRTEFTESTLKEYQQLLSQYDKIAVREDSALEILNRMNIESLGQVLDPTLLLTADEWSSFINCNIKKKYVLIYQLHNDPRLGEYAKRFAEYVNLPLFRISPTFHQITRPGKFIYLPQLEDFLSYIKNCTYLITDSFHGTAFALNFNIQFIEILPNNKTGSRNLSILKLTKLENRIITNYNDFSLCENPINYSNVNHILEREREKSIHLLKNIILS